MHVLRCVRKRQQELPFRNSDSSWHFSRPHFLEDGRNIWFFWDERHFEERCGKKKRLGFLKLFPCIVPTQSKSVWRKPCSIYLTRGASVEKHSSSQQTTPLHPARASPSSSPAVVFSLSLSSPTISRVFSLTLPQFFLSLLIISLRHLFSFLPHRPWLFCSHSEHVQRPVLEIGIKGARLRLGRQSKGVGQGHVALGGMWRDGGLRT